MSTEVTYGVTEHGEPTATFTITGGHDIFRLAFALSNAQCDFADKGRGMFRFLSQVVVRFNALDQALTGGIVAKHALAATHNEAHVVRTARRAWPCIGDCATKIDRGDLYVETTLLKGHEGCRDDRPTRYRTCLACAGWDRAREAVGVHAVRTYVRAERAS